MNKKVFSEQRRREQMKQLGAWGLERLLNEELSDIERWKGIDHLFAAATHNDPASCYYFGRLLATQTVFDCSASPDESVKKGIYYLMLAALNGMADARNFLNDFCQKRYENSVCFEDAPQAPLTDFDGRMITVNRCRRYYPVKAKLDFKNSKNILTLRVNLSFLETDEMENCIEIRNAVRNGIRAWAGEYRVFGGQLLEVKVQITSRQQIGGNVVIVPMTKTLSDQVEDVMDVIKTKRADKVRQSFIKDRRSMMMQGFRKWTVHSPKIMYVQSKDGTFTDLDEIYHVSKHEFGHALGLGDLYKSESDDLPGISVGNYPELDCYHLTDRIYNLVMCDHHGPISNNDIEMVILAFRDNCTQNYQPQNRIKSVSKALGRGN